MNLATIYGTASRRGRLAAAEDVLAAHMITEGGHEVNRIDLASLSLEWADGRDPAELRPHSRDVVDALATADAVVVFTPVYKGSLPGVLKNLFDLLPAEVLLGKVVGCVAMGATLHHFLADDQELRRILTWFGSVPTPTSLYLTGDEFTDGRPNAGVVARLELYGDQVAELSHRLDGYVPFPRPIGKP